MKKSKKKSLSEQETEDCFMIDAAMWGIKFAESVAAVGGDPVAVLRTFTKESVATMIRNGLSVEVDH